MDENATLAERLLFLLLFTGLALGVTAIAGRRGFFRLSKAVAVPEMHVGYVCMAFFCYIAVGLFVAPSLVRFLPRGDDGWLNVLFIALEAIALFAFWKLCPVMMRQAIWSGNRPGFFERLHDFGMGSIGWLVAIPVVAMTQQAVALLLWLFFPGPRPDQAAVQQLRDTLSNLPLFATTAVLIFIVVPAVEELLFRGFLQTWLRGLFGRGAAIILTSLTFALFHFTREQGISNIELLTSLFVLSCYIGFLYERQRSLVGSIGLHATFNGISTIAIFFVGDN